MKSSSKILALRQYFTLLQFDNLRSSSPGLVSVAVSVGGGSVAIAVGGGSVGVAMGGGRVGVAVSQGSTNGVGSRGGDSRGVSHSRGGSRDRSRGGHSGVGYSLGSGDHSGTLDDGSAYFDFTDDGGVDGNVIGHLLYADLGLDLGDLRDDSLNGAGGSQHRGLGDGMRGSNQRTEVGLHHSGSVAGDYRSLGVVDGLGDGHCGNWGRSDGGVGHSGNWGRGDGCRGNGGVGHSGSWDGNSRSDGGGVSYSSGGAEELGLRKGDGSGGVNP